MAGQTDGMGNSGGEGKEKESAASDRLPQLQLEELLDMVHFPPLMLHVGLVLFVGWLASIWQLNLPFIFTLGFAYLWHIEHRQRQKIVHRIRSEEKRAGDRKRSLSDTETVRWLNNVVQSIWPIFLEKFASEHLLMRMAPWFLAKYKPWTANKVVIQKLSLGSIPPVVQFLRVGRHPYDGDHLLLEMDISFSAASDMSAVMAVQMRKRLAGLWATVHVSGIQLEGSLKVGVRFVNGWPVISRVRICFSKPPVIRMVATPIFSRGVDVTDLPGIAAWLDKMIIDALEQSLVAPNFLSIDVEKLVGDLISVAAKLNPGKNVCTDSSKGGDWFHVAQAGALATLLVEIIEAEQLKPCDANGKSDPYVKIILGKTERQTEIKRKTLSPNWHEEFRIPVMSWDERPVLKLHVRDKDRFVDDWMGTKEISVEDLRDGERHDMWLPLDGVKTGRLHIAITVTEIPLEGGEGQECHESPNVEDSRKGSFKDVQDPSLPRSLTRSRSESNGRTVVSEEPDETPLRDEREAVDVGVGESGCVSIVTPGKYVVEEVSGKERMRQRSNCSKTVEKEKKPGKSSTREDELETVHLDPTGPGDGSVQKKSTVRNFFRNRTRSKGDEKKDNVGEDVSGELSPEANELMIVGKTGAQVHMKLELNEEDMQKLEDHGLQDELPIVPESGALDLQGSSIDGPEKFERLSWGRSGLKIGKGLSKQAGKAAQGT